MISFLFLFWLFCASRFVLNARTGQIRVAQSILNETPSHALLLDLLLFTVVIDDPLAESDPGLFEVLASFFSHSRAHAAVLNTPLGKHAEAKQ